MHPWQAEKYCRAEGDNDDPSGHCRLVGNLMAVSPTGSFVNYLETYLWDQTHQCEGAGKTLVQGVRARVSMVPVHLIGKGSQVLADAVDVQRVEL